MYRIFSRFVKIIILVHFSIAVITVQSIIINVTGTAAAQRIHCSVPMLRMSHVFVPNSEEMKYKG